MASAPISCSTPVVIQNGFYHANLTNSNNRFSSQKDGFSRYKFSVIFHHITYFLSRTQTYYAYQTVCPNPNMITPATNTQSCQPTFSAEHRSNYQTAQFQAVNAHFIHAAGGTTASAPQFKPAHNYSRNSSVQNMPISYHNAVSYARQFQYPAKDRSLCQDLFNVGTTDPATNHVS